MVGCGRLRSVAVVNPNGNGPILPASTACALPPSLIKVFQATSSHIKAKALTFHVSRFTFHVSRFTFHVLRFPFHVSRFTFHVPRSIALFEPPNYAPAHASFPRQPGKGRPTRPTHGRSRR